MTEEKSEEESASREGPIREIGLADLVFMSIGGSPRTLAY